MSFVSKAIRTKDEEIINLTEEINRLDRVVIRQTILIIILFLIILFMSVL